MFSALAPTSAKLTTQYLVLDHMTNHYSKITKARRKHFLSFIISMCDSMGLSESIFFMEIPFYRREVQLIDMFRLSLKHLLTDLLSDFMSVS